MATRRNKVLPRKHPKQERAAATVDAILQSTAYILIRDGWEGLNTNKIAKRAGVNIASLYQYFPNKQAIVVELQRRHIARARQTQPHQLQCLRNQPDLRSVLRLVIQHVIAEHSEQPALHRVFSEELPRSTRRKIQMTKDGSEQNVQSMWRACIEPFAKNVPDLEISTFVLKSAVHAVIHDAATERPELLQSVTLSDELVALIERYLVRPQQ